MLIAHDARSHPHSVSERVPRRYCLGVCVGRGYKKIEVWRRGSCESLVGKLPVLCSSASWIKMSIVKIVYVYVVRRYLKK